MFIGRLLFILLLSLTAFNASAGSKRLVVAFLDYTNEGIGKTSFKSLRTSRHDHACWHNFSEIEGIESAFIENPPKALDRTLLLAAIHGSASAAEQFAKALKAEKLNGAYAFVLDATGTFATVYGINYQDGAVSSSASIRKPDAGLLKQDALAKALCEASISMN